MNFLLIEKITESRFTFRLNDGEIISDAKPTLTTFDGKFNFKTSNGANIIGQQNILFNEITVRDTFGGTGDFTFTNTASVWQKLVELNFFGGVGSTGSGGSGVTRFDALNDTFSYLNNDGKVAVVDESNTRLVPVQFFNISEFTELEDVEVETLIEGKFLSVDIIGGSPKIVLKDIVDSQNNLFTAVGGFDYEDVTTKNTPIVYTSGDLQLTNDAQGVNSYANPPFGVTSVWDAESNTFDFSQLSEGDEVFLRVDILHDIGANNRQRTSLKLRCALDSGFEFDISIDSEIHQEQQGDRPIVRTVHFYVRDGWKNNPVRLIYSSSNNSLITVNGWHPYIIRKSVNIIDVTDDNFKTFKVGVKDTLLTDNFANEGYVNVETSGGNVSRFVFDSTFVNYLDGLQGFISTNDIYCKIYNKSIDYIHLAKITSFDFSTTNSVFVEETIEQSLISVNDNLEFTFDVSDQSQTGLVEEINNPLNSYFGTRIQPSNEISGLYNSSSVNGSTGFLSNNISTGNGSISEFKAITNDDVFANNLGAGISLVAFGLNYFQSWLQNKTAIYGGNTDMHFILPTNQSDFIFSLGNTSVNTGNESDNDIVFRINQNKEIIAPLLTNDIISNASGNVLITKNWVVQNSINLQSYTEGFNEDGFYDIIIHEPGEPDAAHIKIIGEDGSIFIGGGLVLYSDPAAFDNRVNVTTNNISTPRIQNMADADGTPVFSINDIPADITGDVPLYDTQNLYANDAEAASGGIDIGKLYVTPAGDLKVRLI